MSRTPKMGRAKDAPANAHQSLLLDVEVVRQIEREARRLDTTPSRLMRRAWRLARAQMAALPSYPAREGKGRSVGLYLPAEMIEEIERESARLDRPPSWLLQHAYALARADIQSLPAAPK